MYINAAGQGILVLNSHKAVGDLLDRRGHIYGDRPRMISKYWRTCLPPYTIHHSSYQVLGELFSGGLLLAAMRLNETYVALSLSNCIKCQTLHSWRRFHRAGQEAFNEMTRGADFHPILSKEAVWLTDGLLRNDGAWEHEYRR